MAKRNPFDKISDNIAKDFTRRLKSAKDTKIVPFGEEEVSPAEFRTRFAGMSKGDRQKTLDINGQAEVLKQLRGG